MSANLTTKQVMAIAGVSHMTVYVWRQGSETRDPLPTVEKEAPAVRIAPAKLKSWAKRYGIELKYDPVGVATGAMKLKSVTADAKATTKPRLKKEVPLKKGRTRH